MMKIYDKSQSHTKFMLQMFDILIKNFLDYSKFKFQILFDISKLILIRYS